MRDARLRAIMLVVHLVRVAGMSIWDACRAAAHREQVDCDWLYREMTE